MTRTHGLAAAAIALVLAGCGNSDSQKKASAHADTPGGVPAVLQGTWQATVDSSRLADAPADLTQERSVWTLKFLGTGGKGNGPSLVLSNDQVGEVVVPISVSGNEITLRSDTECTRFVHVYLGLEKRMIRSTEQQRGCPSTLVSSILQRPWLLVEAGPGHGPTSAEVTRASTDAFVACALRRDDLGTVMGFRDGRVVPLPGQDAPGAKLDLSIGAPRSLPLVLADGGQYVGLRGGAGPDVDIVFWGRPEPVADVADTPLGSVLDEASKWGIVSWSHGDYSKRAGDQEFATVRLEGEPLGWDEDLGALRVARALKPLVPCFRMAVRA